MLHPQVKVLCLDTVWSNLDCRIPILILVGFLIDSSFKHCKNDMCLIEGTSLSEKLFTKMMLTSSATISKMVCVVDISGNMRWTGPDRPIRAQLTSTAIKPMASIIFCHNNKRISKTPVTRLDTTHSVVWTLLLSRYENQLLSLDSKRRAHTP